MSNDTKTCNGCSTDRPLDGFHKQHTSPDGRRSLCKECLAEKSRVYLLNKRFDISPEEYAALLHSQGGVCALCRTEKPGGRWANFHVDHCHETGRVRGVLCHGCNVALGQLGDDAQGLSRALAYVTN